MTQEQHRKHHDLLHKHLDELAADFIQHTEKTLHDTSVEELLKWSYDQTMTPTEIGDI